MLAALMCLAACGSADATRKAAPSSSGPRLAPAECAPAVASTLGDVAARIYHAAGSGVVVGQAVHRVKSSTALVSAVRAHDRAAVTRVLDSLLAGQIARIQVAEGERVLGGAGSGQAIAPVSGSIAGTSARFTLSTQSDPAYMQVTKQVTGAEVLVLNGGQRIAGTIAGGAPTPVPTGTPAPLTYAGHDYEALALPAKAYPKGAIQLALLVPTEQIACHGDAAGVRVETLGTVGERIYKQERESATTKQILRRVETDHAFIDAVAKRSLPATRAAIVHFFASHIHVVRVRVTVPSGSGERLFYDLGGPHVLAPVHGTLRRGGRVVGHFVTAIQDDAGYLKLARRFTGADVLMRTSKGQVEGTLKPGPKTVPQRGPVEYGGRTYQAYTFNGEAFPSGPLRISLLLGS